MTETERKKVEWLHRYQGLLATLEKLKNEQEVIETKLEGLGAQIIDDMPKDSGGGSDKEKLIMCLEDNKKWIIKTSIKIEEERRKIYEAVNEIDDPVLQVLLLYRYLDGMRWEEVCYKMHISWDTVHRWHRKALKYIEIKS